MPSSSSNVFSFVCPGEVEVAVRAFDPGNTHHTDRRLIAIASYLVGIVGIVVPDAHARVCVYVQNGGQAK